MIKLIENSINSSSSFNTIKKLRIEDLDFLGGECAEDIANFPYSPKAEIAAVARIPKKAALSRFRIELSIGGTHTSFISRQFNTDPISLQFKLSQSCINLHYCSENPSIFKFEITE